MPCHTTLEPVFRDEIREFGIQERVSLSTALDKSDSFLDRVAGIELVVSGDGSP